MRAFWGAGRGGKTVVHWSRVCGAEVGRKKKKKQR